MSLKVDVLIVGGGLVGLALARSLAGSKLSLMLVDAAPEPSANESTVPRVEGACLYSGIDPRVSAISPGSSALLKRLDAWPSEEEVCPFTHMLVWDGRGSGRIEFDAATINEPALGYIAQNRSLVTALAAGARQQENLELVWGARIEQIGKDPEGYRVVLADGRAVTCDLLAGADGGNSSVREACGIRTLNWQYDQKALVTTIKTELPHGQVARQCFTSVGSLALLPIAGNSERFCSIVWSSADAANLKALREQDLCDRLTAASERVLGDVLAVDQRFVFPLRQQHAYRYVEPHLALLGDAAHTIHPLAGQGANMGLADAVALACALNDGYYRDQSPGDVRLLKTYERARLPRNLAMGAVMEAFKQLYTPSHPAINWARNAGTRFVDRTPLLKGFLARIATGR